MPELRSMFVYSTSLGIGAAWVLLASPVQRVRKIELRIAGPGKHPLNCIGQATFATGE